MSLLPQFPHCRYYRCEPLYLPLRQLLKGQSPHPYPLVYTGRVYTAPGLSVSLELVRILPCCHIWALGSSREGSSTLAAVLGFCRKSSVKLPNSTEVSFLDLYFPVNVSSCPGSETILCESSDVTSCFAFYHFLRLFTL